MDFHKNSVTHRPGLLHPPADFDCDEVARHWSAATAHYCRALLAEPKVFSLSDFTDRVRRDVQPLASSLKIRLDDDLPSTLYGQPEAVAELLVAFLGVLLRLQPSPTLVLDLLADGLTDTQCLIRFQATVPAAPVASEVLSTWALAFDQCEPTLDFRATLQGGVQSDFALALTVRPETSVSVPAATFTQLPPLAGTRILVVEDNEINQQVAGKFLHHWQIAPDFALDGHEAQRLVQAHEYDVILMDLQMPKMDGYEAARLIRQMPKPWCQRVAIIALTAAALPIAREKAMAAGMTDFLTKPFRPEVLHGLISRYRPAPKLAAPLLNFRHFSTLGNPTHDAEFLVRITELSIAMFGRFGRDCADVMRRQDRDAFRRMCHEVRATVKLLDIAALQAIMDEGSALLLNAPNAEATEAHIVRAVRVCQQIEETLRRYLAHLRA